MISKFSLQRLISKIHQGFSPVRAKNTNLALFPLLTAASRHVHAAVHGPVCQEGDRAGPPACFLASPSSASNKESLSSSSLNDLGLPLHLPPLSLSFNPSLSSVSLILWHVRVASSTLSPATRPPCGEHRVLHVSATSLQKDSFRGSFAFEI